MSPKIMSNIRLIWTRYSPLQFYERLHLYTWHKVHTLLKYVGIFIFSLYLYLLNHQLLSSSQLTSYKCCRFCCCCCHSQCLQPLSIWPESLTLCRQYSSTSIPHTHCWYRLERYVSIYNVSRSHVSRVYSCGPRLFEKQSILVIMS